MQIAAECIRNFHQPMKKIESGFSRVGVIGVTALVGRGSGTASSAFDGHDVKTTITRFGALTWPTRPCEVGAVSVVLPWPNVLIEPVSVRLMHAQPWIAHPGPRLGERFGAGYHRFDKQSRLAHHLRKFGSLAPPRPHTPIRHPLYS